MNCDVCGGPIRRNNVIGVCARNELCNAERNRRWTRVSNGDDLLRQYDATERPEAGACECGEPVYVHRKRDGSWKRWNKCSQCMDLRSTHGMTKPERDDYLSQGCAIEGCLRPATHIDHDHAVCSTRKHSCEKCRRGPLCHKHNTREIALLDALFAGKLTAELSYLGRELV